jgi:hypothetical protein
MVIMSNYCQDSSLLVDRRKYRIHQSWRPTEITVVDNVKKSGPTPDYSPPFQGGVGGGCFYLDTGFRRYDEGIQRSALIRHSDKVCPGHF